MGELSSRPSTHHLASIRIFMNTVFRSLTLMAVLAMASGISHGADFFNEDFNSVSLTSPLIVPIRYVTGGNATPSGSLQNNVFSDFRDFVRTTATDYNMVDFQMELTVSVRGSNPSQTAFVGIGSSIPDPNYFTEPHTSIYMRLFPDDFLAGSLGITVTPDASSHTEAIVSTQPHPGAGDHRVQIRKIGNTLTLSADIDYAGGAFVPDYAVAKQIDTDLPFLNSGNSRLFFGVQGASTTFDNLQIKQIGVPEQGVGFWVTATILSSLAIGRWKL